MIQAVLSWFTSGALKGLAEELKEAYQATLDAKTDGARLEAQTRMAIVRARVDAQTQGAGSIWAKIVRAGFAAPFIVLLWKLIVWDKVLGLGATDDLSQNLWDIFKIILAFYFIDNSIRLLRR